jgi:c-di-GMP-binding flagellar brake protein YcgR
MLPHDPAAVTIRKGAPRPQDAITQIPASASSFEMTSEDDIGDILTLLAANGDAISMYVAGSREVVLGRILSVDPEQPHFVMELNEGETLRPGNVTFVACPRSAKLQFRLASKEWGSVPGKPQLIPMVFPETCAILNRRAHERLETPLGVNFTASFVVNGHTYELPIHDYSPGGIGLRCAKNAAKGLLKGRKLVEIQLDLDEETILLPEMEIRVTRNFRSFLMGEQLHIGCMFTHMTPESEAELKKLLDLIEHAPQHR